MNAFSTDTSIHNPHSQAQFSPQMMFLGSTQYPESIAYWHDPGLPPPVIPAVDSTSTRKGSIQTTAEQRKHKRTRSGCFTCRLRRVKCDEGRPICDRCKKGNRECKYPPPSSKSGGNRQNQKGSGARKNSGGSLSSDDNDISPKGLDAIPDRNEEEEEEDEEGTQSSVSQKSSTPRLPSPHIKREKEKDMPRKNSDSSLLRNAPQDSQRTGLPARFTSQASTNTSSTTSHSPSRSARLSILPEDIQFYIKYHQENLNYHHYTLKSESAEFVHSTILDQALIYEPLLYAVVGFAAWHYALEQADGKLNDFLKYYHRSLTLLRESLASKKQRGEGTLLTTLQLATFEEGIGDYVNLIDHQLAANALMGEILSKESILTNNLHRQIFIWYSTFDVTVGILANSEVILSREWYTNIEQHDAHQAALHPTDVPLQLAWVRSQLRLFALDFASLHAKLTRGIIGLDQFLVHHNYLQQKCAGMRSTLKGLLDPAYEVQFGGGGPNDDLDDVFDPVTPTRVYRGPLWAINFTWVDILATELMVRFQSLHILQQNDYTELKSISLQQCRIMEATLRCAEGEKGTIMGFKSPIAISSMFLPRDQKFMRWTLRKVVSLEQSGCILPPKYRSALAEVFQMPEINHWWLPNDEGCPNAVREIRAMVDERINNPRDHFREDVRDLKYFFQNFSIDDSGSQGSPSTLAAEPSPPDAAYRWQQPARSLHCGDDDYSPSRT